MKKNEPVFVNGQGFTLIEMLLSVMIIAFLAGSLYATFAAGLKIESRTKQSFQDIDEERLILEQLYKDLGRAAAYDFRGSFPDRKSFTFKTLELVFLIDDNHELKWVRYMLVPLEQGHVKETRLGVTSTRNVAVTNVTSAESRVMTLVRDENDFVHFFDMTDVPQRREVLSRRLIEKGWEVLVAASIATQPKMEWKPEWQEVFLPAAIRVNVSTQSRAGSVRKWTRDFILPSGGRDEP